MALKPGRPTRRGRITKARNKQKAIAIAKVLKKTGKLNFEAAHRIYSPDAAESTHKAAQRTMWNEGVMDELEKLLKVRDKDLLKKLTPEVIVQDLLEDLRMLNELVKLNKTDWEAVVKLLMAKGVKQKLIGMAIGIWKAEKPQEREKSAGELFAQLDKLGGRN